MRDTGYYLDKRNGKMLGVCAGFAQQLGIDVLWVRIVMLLLLLMTGGVAILFYLMVAVIAPSRPPEGRTLPTGGLSPFAVEELRATLKSLDQRLGAVEKHLTDPARQLARRIDDLRD